MYVNCFIENLLIYLLFNFHEFIFIFIFRLGTECTATFVYPEHYKKHIRIHTGVKPFACETCGKTFNSRDNRNAHRFVHTEKKPYGMHSNIQYNLTPNTEYLMVLFLFHHPECLVCHQSFMRKPLLIAHMRTQQHGEDEFIHNKPDFQDSKDNNNLRTITGNDTENQNETEDDDDANDIIYLSVNDKGFIEDDCDCIDDDIDDDGDGHFVSGWVLSSSFFNPRFGIRVWPDIFHF